MSDELTTKVLTHSALVHQPIKVLDTCHTPRPTTLNININKYLPKDFAIFAYLGCLGCHHNLLKYFPYWRSRLVTEKERRNVRRSHLLITTVILFVICWLPLNILNLGEDLDLPLQTWRQSGALSLVQIPPDTLLWLVEPYYAGTKVYAIRPGRKKNYTPTLQIFSIVGSFI